MNGSNDLEKMLPETWDTAAIDMPRLDQLFLQLRLVSELLGQAPPDFNRPALVFRDREGRVTVHEVGERLRVGRSSECELAFPGLREVSRLQFEIIREEDRYVIADCGSANGTYVNGSRERTVRSYLRSGDAIEAAGFIFAFIWD